jgi:hypothetical protein
MDPRACFLLSNSNMKNIAFVLFSIISSASSFALISPEPMRVVEVNVKCFDGDSPRAAVARVEKEHGFTANFDSNNNRFYVFAQVDGNSEFVPAEITVSSFYDDLLLRTRYNACF